MSLCQAPLTFSHLTMEGTCYICLRLCGCARNSSSRSSSAALFLGRNRNGSFRVLAAARAVDCKCRSNRSPSSRLRHIQFNNHACKQNRLSVTLINLKAVVSLGFYAGAGLR